MLRWGLKVWAATTFLGFAAFMMQQERAAKQAPAPAPVVMENVDEP